MSGSGFLIRADGTTGYVVTNAHVVTPPREGDQPPARPTITVCFRGGTKAEAEATAEVVASALGRDLAILRVAGVPNLPKPIDLAADEEPFETMTVYIFGFPFGEMLALGRGNPPVNVARGQVSSVRRGQDDRIRYVLVDGALNPGNSGGPVVDAKGRLVGVSVATIRGANIGFVIAVPQLLDMLTGKVEGTNVSLEGASGGSAELAVEAPLVDPLGRVKSARMLWTTGAAKFSKTEAAARRDDEENGPLGMGAPVEAPGPTFGPIERAKTAPLKVAAHRASGVLKLPATGKDVEFWCQVALDDGAGKTIFAQPGRYFLGARGPKGATFWGEVVDPDGDCQLDLRDGELVGIVPGTLHDLNVDIRKNNAPRVVQEVVGDFVAQVKVSGSFHPGPIRTGPKSVPYNGGGLVVWLDEGNYIRLERAAMYRNDRVMGFLAFESRERGTRAEVHNKGGLDPGRDLWLRVARLESVISGAYSLDGQTWEDLRPMEIDWPSRLRVGVDLVNSCGDPMTVRFAGYSLTTSGGAR
jgi:regulation of enolase protein 1 (concanavalin A-like superfamily)